MTKIITAGNITKKPLKRGFENIKTLFVFKY